MKKGTVMMEILRPRQGMDVVIATPVDPKEFFVTRKGLCVWSGFTEKIVPKAVTSDAGTRAVESLDLMVDARDVQIELSLGNKNVFTESEAAELVAEMISRQPDGKDGDLLTSGYANLFYTPECVVSVYWGSGEWCVGAWDRDGDEWHAGIRVFSPQLGLDI